MQNLGPKEAAAAIKDAMAVDPLPPEEAHQMRFLQQVCSELGLDHTAQSLRHVALTLRHHGIALHSGHEYPKHVIRKWDQSDHIVNSAEEADAVINEAPPAPPQDVTDGPPQPAAGATFSDVGDQTDHQHVNVDEVADDEVHVEEADSNPKPATRKRPQ